MSIELIKKLLLETIRLSNEKNEKISCNSLMLFVSYNSTTLSDVAHCINDLKNKGEIDSDFGKDLKCIDLMLEQNK